MAQPEIVITLEGLQEALLVLDRLARRTEGAMKRTLFRIATTIKDTAVDYAPISPTQQLINRARVTRRKVPRKARAYSRTKPGGLRRSIDFTATETDAEIFVASNSEAGPYAWRIHNERWNKWFKRGLGTKAAGEQAREKFIERAIIDRADDSQRIIQDMTNKVIAGL